MVVDEREDLTVEERLKAAEKRIAFLNREVVSLGWGLFAVVAVAVIAVVVNTLWFSHQHPRRRTVMPARVTCWLAVFTATTAPRNAPPRGSVPWPRSTG